LEEYVKNKPDNEPGYEVKYIADYFFQFINLFSTPSSPDENRAALFGRV
jgi:hypothetical protein